MRLLLSFSFFIFWSVMVPGQQKVANSPSEQKQLLWEKLAPYFLVPEEYKENFGSYRSPLQFYDGPEVKAPDDWAVRRSEILLRWHRLMGGWPPFLENQNMKVVDSVHRDGLTQYGVEFLWTPLEKTKGYLLVPEGAGKRPAVITVFYEPETAIGLGGAEHSNRDFAWQLAKRGFVTLSIGTTEATEAKTYSIYYPDIDHAAVEPLSMLAYAAANAWYALSKRPEVDAARIGIMGHFFGGKWAMFASCLFDKFACAVWSDPGIVFDESRKDVNYWEPWYLGYQPPPWRKRGMITADNPATGLYPQLVKEGYDLHELHALMAPRPFLVSGGSEDGMDRWVPLNHSVAVNQLLGFRDRVGMTNRPMHSPTEESNEIAYLFFEYFLKKKG